MSRRTITKWMRQAKFFQDNGFKGALASRARTVVMNPKNPKQTARVAPGQIVVWTKLAKRAMKPDTRYGIA